MYIRNKNNLKSEKHKPKERKIFLNRTVYHMGDKTKEDVLKKIKYQKSSKLDFVHPLDYIIADKKFCGWIKGDEKFFCEGGFRNNPLPEVCKELNLYIKNYIDKRNFMVDEIFKDVIIYELYTVDIFKNKNGFNKCNIMRKEFPKIQSLKKTAKKESLYDCREIFKHIDSLSNKNVEKYNVCHEYKHEIYMRYGVRLKARKYKNSGTLSYEEPIISEMKFNKKKKIKSWKYTKKIKKQYIKNLQ